MKRILVSHIYLPIIIVMLIFVFTSCSTVTTLTTGIVTIDLDIGYILGIGLGRPSDNYYIYMDGIYQGTMTGSGALTITDVLIGNHKFDAYNYLIAGVSFNLYDNEDTRKDLKYPINGYNHCSGTVAHVVETGINYVTIPVYCTPIE